MVSGSQCHPPEDAEATPGAGPQAAEAKSTVAGQVSEGEGEMLDGRAGWLPAGGGGGEEGSGGEWAFFT